MPPLRAALGLALVAACRGNPQVLAFERAEANREYDAMLARMDSNDDKKLSAAELEAIEDEWLLEEVHIRTARKADKNGDGRVDIEEFAAAWGASDLHGGRSGAATLAVDFVPEFPNLTPMLVMPFHHFVAQGCASRSRSKAGATRRWRRGGSSSSRRARARWPSSSRTRTLTPSPRRAPPAERLTCGA